MSKSIKLKDNIYLDSTGVVHNRQLLSDILNIKKYTAGNYLVNGWSSNGASLMFNFNGLKVLSISVRYGTSTTVMENLPSDMRPTAPLLVPANDQTNGGWASINNNGTVTVKQTLVTSQAVQFVAVYY